MDRREAYRELVIIKINFKMELDRCRDRAKKVLKKISWYLIRGNGEHAEAHREEAIKIRNQAMELVKKIDEVRQMQEEIRRTA